MISRANDLQDDYRTARQSLQSVFRGRGPEVRCPEVRSPEVLGVGVLVVGLVVLDSVRFVETKGREISVRGLILIWLVLSMDSEMLGCYR